MIERRTVPISERIGGTALLTLLVLLGLFLVTREPYYAVQELTALPAQGAQLKGGKAPSVPEPAGPLLPATIPETVWERDGPVEVYPEDRLYEKIDGLDERYKLYGVKQLSFAAYVSPESPQERIDVYCYEMRSPLGALGIFGRERPPGVTVTTDLGEAGYQIECTAYFRKGRYYVQIRGYSDLAKEPCERLARYLSQRIPEERDPVTSFPFLPREGRVPGSERFEPQDAILGTDFLKNVFSAEYVLKDAGGLGQPSILFVVHCGSEESAIQTAARYLEHLSRQGKVLRTEEIEGVTATIMDLDGLFEAFWTQGELFAGVAEAPDQTTLRTLALSLARTLQAQAVPALPLQKTAVTPGTAETSSPVRGASNRSGAKLPFEEKQ